MTYRKTTTGKAPDVVNCRNCGWHYEGVNGLGLAAQHHDRTGHTVDIDTFGFVTYGDRTVEYDDHERRPNHTGESDGE